MAWAKLHTDILHDPKLMRAARRGLKGLEFLPWVIAFAKQADDEGYLSVGGEPADTADIASGIPCATRKQVADCLKSLEKIGVLERVAHENTRKPREFLRFFAWEKRSGTKPSDDPSAIRARVARHRARGREAQPETESEDTKTETNAVVTTGNALHPEASNATEKIREEKNKKRTEKEASPTFQKAWELYPKRLGSNPRAAALRAWSARVKEGADEAFLLSQTERYRAHCEARGIVGQEFVMKASRFWGSDRDYETDWEVPARPPTDDPLVARVVSLQREEAEREANDAAWLARRRIG